MNSLERVEQLIRDANEGRETINYRAPNGVLFPIKYERGQRIARTITAQLRNGEIVKAARVK